MNIIKPFNIITKNTLTPHKTHHEHTFFFLFFLRSFSLSFVSNPKKSYQLRTTDKNSDAVRNIYLHLA